MPGLGAQLGTWIVGCLLIAAIWFAVILLVRSILDDRPTTKGDDDDDSAAYPDRRLAGDRWGVAGRGLRTDGSLAHRDRYAGPKPATEPGLAGAWRNRRREDIAGRADHR